MGHGKNKQKNQKVGLGQQPKETREERRRRIEEEAKAREFCMKLLPYALGGLLFLVLAFALYVHSLPPAISIERLEQSIKNIKIDGENKGMTFEEAMQAEIDEAMRSEIKDTGVVEPEEVVVNLDGDGDSL
ncbi:hypothetical protein ACHAWT_009516 [Skeletonema menzelii]|mmetsp:Transcript_9870/g.16332  ORF Transcript_9870/g.16332 Transcript_9870/m.16332 type:complete len:131 (+) Transcript_9870:141-533(+)|eukprot:scaffold9116_cov148-Skeletonema_menzelii.AAC.11